MRILSKLVVGAAVAATAVTMVAPSALADPPRGVVPRGFDVVGVGSNTTEFVVDQFSFDYNRTHPTHNATHPHLFSWDASPSTATFRPKQGCAPITRLSANGSSAGIKLLTGGAKGAGGAFCEDFARSSRARKSTDPAFGPGGVAFVKFARDAITYATRITGPTNAPHNLTTAQLHAIYTCTARHWNQVGGRSRATILAILPQASSGTEASWLKDIGVTTPGTCVFQTTTLEENQGVTPVFNSPNAIVPFSIGKWIAQKFHHNRFGSAVDGFLGLNSINGTRPTLGTGARQVINPRFSPTYFRFLYNVVRFAANTPDHIPANLRQFFSHTGWICTNSLARAAIVAYGFLNTPGCGQTS
jgi:ABC-type phosphate transport system substrate-binding protein